MKLTVTGANAVASSLNLLSRDVRSAAKVALREFGEEEMTESKKRVPVDTGTLRASGTVSEEESGDKLQVALTYGGPASEYAATVHEDLEAFHPVGEAKYLESVLDESAPFLTQRVGEKIKKKIGA